MPELITPMSRMRPSLPRKSQRVRIASRITTNPTADRKTRKKAVGITPMAGTNWRMNRKLAPQMAARASRFSRAAGFIKAAPGR